MNDKLEFRNAVDELYYVMMPDKANAALVAASELLYEKLTPRLSDGRISVDLENDLSDYATAYQKYGFTTGFQYAVRLLMDAGGRANG